MLIHRPHIHQAQPGDVLYDEVLTVEGHKFYVLMPYDDRPDLLEEVLGLYEDVQRLRAMMEERRAEIPSLSEQADDRGLQTCSRSIQKVYRILIGVHVVAWDDTPGGAIFYPTEEDKENLPLAWQSAIAEKIVEMVRLWLLAF